MTDIWLRRVTKARRIVWMTELITVLVLLLLYKFTSNETALMLTFLSTIIASVPLAGMTLIIDTEELNKEE